MGRSCGDVDGAGRPCGGVAGAAAVGPGVLIEKRVGRLCPLAVRSAKSLPPTPLGAGRGTQVTMTVGSAGLTLSYRHPLLLHLLPLHHAQA